MKTFDQAKEYIENIVCLAPVDEVDAAVEKAEKEYFKKHGYDVDEEGRDYIVQSICLEKLVTIDDVLAAPFDKWFYVHWEGEGKEKSWGDLNDAVCPHEFKAIIEKQMTKGFQA